MSDKVILPFEDTPISYTYQNIAFPLGVIQGNAREGATPWLLSRYANCWFSSKLPSYFSFYEADVWGVKDNILFQQDINLFKDQFDAVIGESFVSLFKKMILLGYYPSGNYNEEFIPGKKAFRKRYYLHDFVLFGVDDDAGVFISAGYLADNKYQKFTIPYDCMENAITSLGRDKIYYNFWKYNENAIFKPNHPKIAVELADYLHSTNSQAPHILERTWGLNALSDLGEFVVDLYEKENHIDARCTRAVMEFKRLMHMRIGYLLSNRIIDDQKYLDCAYEILRLSEIGHLLGVRFLLTKEKKIAYKINDIYQKIVALEKIYLPEVLLDLQHSISQTPIM